MPANGWTGNFTSYSFNDLFDTSSLRTRTFTVLDDHGTTETGAVEETAFVPEKEFSGAENWHPTGSNYICNPPVENTDIDYIAYYKDPGDIPRKWKRKAIPLSGEYNVETGGNYRWKKYNLIHVSTEDDFNKWVKATEIAKELNLLDKKDRVSLFDAVIKGKDPNHRWIDHIIPWE
jgi:hypothetical protein